MPPPSPDVSPPQSPSAPGRPRAAAARRSGRGHLPRGRRGTGQPGRVSVVRGRGAGGVSAEGARGRAVVGGGGGTGAVRGGGVSARAMVAAAGVAEGDPRRARRDAAEQHHGRPGGNGVLARAARADARDRTVRALAAGARAGDAVPGAGGGGDVRGVRRAVNGGQRDRLALPVFGWCDVRVSAESKPQRDAAHHGQRGGDGD